jgi:hypothetical protein
MMVNGTGGTTYAIFAALVAGVWLTPAVNDSGVSNGSHESAEVGMVPGLCDTVADEWQLSLLWDVGLPEENQLLLREGRAIRDALTSLPDHGPPLPQTWGGQWQRWEVRGTSTDTSRTLH